jgi:hypothetical protein
MISIAVNSLAQAIRFIFNTCHQLRRQNQYYLICQQVKSVTDH